MSTPELSATILRYWLSLLRQEEALTTRPKARRMEHPTLATSASVVSPTAGQDYVKLPFADAAAFLVENQGTLGVAATGECSAFFENWLAAQYRRSGEEVAMDHLVFFPALLTPRQELAGILRFPVEIEWRDASGARFEAPTAAERAKKRYPMPPSTLRVSATAESPETSLFVDTRVLSDVLRVDQERLEGWLVELQREARRPRETVARVRQLLADQLTADGAAPSVASQASSTPSATELLADFVRIVKARLAQVGSATKAYDLAVLLDASRNKATFHVQRDIQEALELLSPEMGEASLPPDSPLPAYLDDKRRRGKRRSLLGRFEGQPLTDSQRAAGELFLGSTICAVQGPPGTGKTHLILSLAAQQLIDNTLQLCEAKQPSEESLVVTSTNNRAVDNVIDPLSRHFTGLPLALRVGSREVMDRLTAVELEKVMRWLERRPEPKDDDWDAATSRLKTLHATVTEACASEVSTRSAAEASVQNHAELEALEQRLAQDGTLETRRVPPFIRDRDRAVAASGEIKAHTIGLLIRLRSLSDLAESEKRTPLLALDQHFKLSTTRHLTPLAELLGAPLPLRLPPKTPTESSADERRVHWEEAAEEAIAVVEHFDEWLSDVQRRQVAQRRVAELRQQLALTPSSASGSEPPEVDWGALEPILHELFRAACEVRELWAARNKKPLIESIQRAVQACKGQKSLRSLLSAGKGPGLWLQRLFPVWGCTLLSLGNNFSPTPQSLAKVVIDEAGQCHPAYAVSAMLRARAALVIGDTNQLEPVIELSRADEARLLKAVKGRYRDALEPYRAYEGSHSSAQSVADRVVFTRPILIDHFRCQPEIAAICEQLCNYGIVARTPRRSCAAQVAELDHPLLVTPVAGEQQRVLGSWGNAAEVDQVVQWLTHVLRAGLSPADIGVITPFRGQLDLLWRELRQARIPLEKPLLGDDDDQLSLLSHATSGVALGTVHRFQGGERRVILFSTTVTETNALRFLNERVNLVNVAASRAKEHLVTIGHGPTLAAGANTRYLLKGAQRRAPNSPAS